MFSRRVATFLLGIWIGCCLLVDVFALQGRYVAERILENPVADARDVILKAGPGNATLLLRHLSAEQTRGLLDTWEIAQLIVGGAMAVLLVFTDQRKSPAITLLGVMVVIAFFQHFFVMPDWTIVGREADFVPEAAAFPLQSRLWALTQTYGALEIVKLLVGGSLASYFFVMDSSKRIRRKDATREADAFNASAR